MDDIDSELVEIWGEHGPEDTLMLQKILSELGSRIATEVMWEREGKGTYTIDIDVTRKTPIKIETLYGTTISIAWKPKLGGN